MFTSSQNQVNALRAMKTKKISDATAAAMEGMNDVRVRGGIAVRHRAFVG